MTFQVFGPLFNPLRSSASTGYKPLVNGGLVDFLNNVITLITVIAGIWTVFNFIAAGYQYLNSNNEPQKITAAGNKILQSVIGLAVVAAAYVIGGIISFILFKDATVLLNPKLQEPF